MDVNLKVVLVWDLGKKPLTKEEFQQRKADPTQRKTMKEEFNQPYNVTDSYVAVNTYDKNVDWQEQLKNKENNNNTKDWANWLPAGKEDGVAGKSAPFQFAAFINSEELGTLTTSFLTSHPQIQQATAQVKDGNRVNINKALGKEFEKILAQTIAATVEHETGHHKFKQYSENDAGSPYDTKMEMEKLGKDKYSEPYSEKI